MVNSFALRAREPDEQSRPADRGPERDPQRQRTGQEVLGSMADILFLRGDLSGAGRLYQQAIGMEARLDNGSNGAEGRGELERSSPTVSVFARIGSEVEENGLAEESRAELAELAIEEGHPDQAESLTRPAIAEFEKEKSDPSSAGAYTVLSRALLALGKLEDARVAAEHANALSRTSSDPELKLPAVIQLARIEMAAFQKSAPDSNLPAARAELNSAVESAKKTRLLPTGMRMQIGTG